MDAADTWAERNPREKQHQRGRIREQVCASREQTLTGACGCQRPRPMAENPVDEDSWPGGRVCVIRRHQEVGDG